MQFIDLGDNPAAVAAALASKQVDGIYQGNIEQFDLYKGMVACRHPRGGDGADRGRAHADDQKPFDNPKVRKAMRLATDPAKCLQIAHKGVGQAAEHHHVCTVHPDYKKIEPLGFKPEEAKKLLAEAGFPDGIDIEINCKPDPSWEQAAVEAMAEQWKAGGIRAKINVLPSAKFWELWTEVPFGFTEWTHRPLGLHGAGACLSHRRAVERIAIRTSSSTSCWARPKARSMSTSAARSWANSRAIMLEDGPITQPLWRSVYAAYDKRVEGLPDPSDALHLRRDAGDQAGLVWSPNTRLTEPASYRLRAFFSYPRPEVRPRAGQGYCI